MLSILHTLKACDRSSLTAKQDTLFCPSYAASPSSSTLLRKSMYLLASFRVWIFDSLSEGRVGTISRSFPKASFRLCVRCLSRTLAWFLWCISSSCETGCLRRALGLDCPQEAELAELPLLPEFVLFLARVSWVSGLGSDRGRCCWLLSGEWVMACRWDEVRSAIEIEGNSRGRRGELGGMVWKAGRGRETSVCSCGECPWSG